MRQIVLDTETTGLSPEKGHRLTEIGCLELYNRQLTGAKFHTYVNPEREIDEGAKAVTGLTEEFLADKPKFIEVVEPFLDFIDGAELIIHNAPFDVGFINHELSLCRHPWGHVEKRTTVLDTLVIARKLHPGQRNNLDALCQRYKIDNTHRTYHGALLDAEILAEVYLQMTAGQTTFAFSGEVNEQRLETQSQFEPTQITRSGNPLPIIQATGDESIAHRAKLKAIQKQSDNCLWLKVENES